MKKFFSKYGKDVAFSGIIILCIVMICCMILLVDEYSNVLEEQSVAKISSYADDTSNLIQQTMFDLEKQASIIAERISVSKSHEDISVNIAKLSSDPAFSDVGLIRFFHDGVEYNSTGFEFAYQESREVLELVGSEKTMSSGLVHDLDTNMSLVAFYVPVSNCKYVDAVVVFYPTSVIKRFSENADVKKIEKAEIIALCSGSGTIIDTVHNSTASIQKYDNILEVIREYTNNKDVVNNVEKIINLGKNDVLSISINGQSYNISVCSTGERGGRVCVIGLYNASKAYSTGYEFVSNIIVAIIIFFAILIVFAIYLMIHRHVTQRRILEMNTINKTLNCPTFKKIENDITGILNRNKVTKFALVVSEVQHFDYIRENFDDMVATNTLLFLKTVYSKAIVIDERYSYLDGGTFVLLVHYRDSDELLHRLNVISSIASNYTGFESLKLENYSLKLIMGIYEIDRNVRLTTDQMLSRAIVAKDYRDLINKTKRIRFYNDSMREQYMREASIESKMENALKNGEFEVFYQPKLNLVKDRIDGCEALVRWYDKEEDSYMSPSVFLPIFEIDGFVIELDRYVYKSVCEYIKESVSVGRKIYPVSVNVSRVTAIQPDFLDYYVKKKKAYGIADKYIVLEFTESFAYENYDVLKLIIGKLHSNGFLCSVDDFGSGYSSYNILKELHMDEIKLDKFFIERSDNPGRDDTLLANVIDVAKKLGMKVTQEGVETLDDFARLKKFGCDVIQGYYYSKPLSAKNYVDFIEKIDRGTEVID